MAAVGGVSAEAGTLCDDEEDVDAAGALFCGSGASGSASDAASIGCAICVRACNDAQNEKARASAVAEMRLGGNSALTWLVYLTEVLTECSEQAMQLIRNWQFGRVRALR